MSGKGKTGKEENWKALISLEAVMMHWLRVVGPTAPSTGQGHNRPSAECKKKNKMLILIKEYAVKDISI